MKKNTGSADFCANRIDVITNFPVITNAVIKKVHCILISLVYFCCKMGFCLTLTSEERHVLH